jgi:signal transduction histidine kinase
MLEKLLEYIPHGNMLLVHIPGLFVFGLVRGESLEAVAWAIGIPLACLAGGHLVHHRRWASFFVTVGLVYCSLALVGLSDGSIEAHFHFFIIIGFTAVYQDWVPFLWNILFTTLSHGIGSAVQPDLIFNHEAGQANPWVWSTIHGVSVLAACAGVVIFWKASEQEQHKSLSLMQRLTETKIAHRQFTSDLLVNLARRNQSLLYRQLDVINQLEEEEKNPDTLADLFRLDHLATRIRRNAESLLVLSGENPPRTWTKPVPLLDVIRAAIAETEELDRVVFHVDDDLAVRGHAVADLAHLIAELVENATRFSPPDTSVNVRTRRSTRDGGHILTVEDWGMGMPADELAAANELLASPHEVDLSVAQRLGLHVVARLAQRHDVHVSLTQTPGGGLTAVLALPEDLFVPAGTEVARLPAGGPAAAVAARQAAASMPPAPYPEPAPYAQDDGQVEYGEEEPAYAQNGVSGGVFPEPVDQEPVAPAPVFAEAEPPEARANNGPRLARRVPQAHLAPQLHNGQETTAPEPPSSRLPSAAKARAALSRYQASRNAARADLAGKGGYGPNGKGDGHTDGSGWRSWPPDGGWP